MIQWMDAYLAFMAPLLMCMGATVALGVGLYGLFVLFKGAK